MRAPTIEEQLITVGMALWNFDASEDPDIIARTGLGGIVVSIETDRDLETGEIQRRFVTVKQVGRDKQNDLGVRFDEILAADIKQIHPMNSASVRGMIRRLGDALARSKGAWLTNQRRCAAAIAALDGALVGADS